MKNKLLSLLSVCLLATNILSADAGILAENARDYRKSIDSVINQYLDEQRFPSIDQALRIQACENDMLALARLDPSLASTMPELLLAHHVRLRDLRHLPGELMAARAKAAGLDVLSPVFDGAPIEYIKGAIFQRTKRFDPPTASSTFPKAGDWIAHHAYALHCMQTGEYEQASEHFEKAGVIKESRGGTKRKVWEFENLVCAAWAYVLSGDSVEAKKVLSRAMSLDVQAPPSRRAQYLSAAIHGQTHPSLGMALNHSLAQR